MRCSDIFEEKWCAGRKCGGKANEKFLFPASICDSFCSLDWTGTAGSWGEEEPTDDVSGVRIICQEADIQIGEKSLLQGFLLGADPD